MRPSFEVLYLLLLNLKILVKREAVLERLLPRASDEVELTPDSYSEPEE